MLQKKRCSTIIVHNKQRQWHTLSGTIKLNPLIYVNCVFEDPVLSHRGELLLQLSRSELTVTDATTISHCPGISQLVEQFRAAVCRVQGSRLSPK